MAEENKKGAGRPRTTQYYLLSYAHRDPMLGMTYGDIAFSCEIFPTRFQIEALTGYKGIAISSVFKFPCKEDFDNYNLGVL